jgi:(+)-beta-caryophyllene/(+)-caryolan-1-ol synthase
MAEYHKGRTVGHREERNVPGSYEVPAVVMPIAEYGVSAAIDVAEQDIWSWLDEHRLLEDPLCRQRMVRTQPYDTTARYFPYGVGAELVVVNRFMALAFFIDDQFDNDAEDTCAVERFCEDLIAVSTGCRSPVSEVERAMRELVQTLTAGRSPGWREAFDSAVIQWLRTYPVEARLVEHGQRMGFREYLPHRRHSGGMAQFLHLHEYVHGIDLPAAVRDLPAMQQARNLVCEWVGLYNDLYSVTKEQDVGYQHNALLIVRETTGGSLQDSAAIVNDVLTGLLDQFEAACRAAPPQVLAVSGHDPAARDDAAHVLDGYRRMLRGNFDYHIESPRYQTT